MEYTTLTNLAGTGFKKGRWAPNQLLAPVTLTGGRSCTAAVTDKQVVRSREVAINMELLNRLVAAVPGTKAPKPSLTFELFDGQVLTAVPLEVNSTKRGVSWIGKIEGMEHGQVELVISDGIVSANITMLFPPDHPPADLTPAINRPAEPEKNPVSAPLDDGSTIDVMVVYTGAARAAAGGTSAIVGLIDTAMTETNASYLNSGIAQRVRLVHAEEVSYVETSSTSSAAFNAALTCIQSTTDGCLDALHSTRDTHGADLVSLWIENSGSCGLGYFNSSASYAFSVVARTCATGYYSFGHEMGHNMGAHHDPYVEASTTPRTYQHGTTNAAAASPWRTVMAYNNACTAAGVSCTRIPYWSNPNVNYGGAAMGDATTRDNHRVLNETAYAVANFRTSVQSTLPAAPTIGTAVPGNASISVAFTPGAIGSGTLVSYWAYCTPNGGSTVVNR